MAVQKLHMVTRDGSRYWEADPACDPEYVGCVLSLKTKYNVRKMSDIWAYDFYAVVWTDNGAIDVFLSSNFELQEPTAKAKVDATSEVKAAYKEWAEAMMEAARKTEEARRTAQREIQAEQEAKAVNMGDRVLVYKGRKVPVGTEGVIFWEGDDGWGPRVGIKDNEGTAHWTARSNVQKTVNKPEGMTWTEFMTAQQKAEAKRAKTLPVKGEMALVLEGDHEGETGMVFWERDGRIGLATSDRKDASGKSLDVLWLTTNECRRFTGEEALAVAEQRAEANKAKAKAAKKAKKVRQEELSEVDCPF